MSIQTFFISFILVASPIRDLVGAPFSVTDSKTTGRTRFNCSSAAGNGVVEIHCWGYVECINGFVNVHTCNATQVLERDTMTCVNQGIGNTDCIKQVSCVGKDDAMYADWEHGCQTYVSCLGGSNIGRQYCSATLVFNETIQTCDFKTNVDPPCGTKVIVG